MNNLKTSRVSMRTSSVFLAAVAFSIGIMTAATTARAFADEATDRIIFSRSDDSGDTYSISPDGLTLTNLGGLSEYRLSADGNTIIYSDGSGIFIRAASGGTPVDLTAIANPAGAYYWTPVWSPDESRILFTAQDSNGDCYAYTMDTDGTNLELVASAVQDGSLGGVAWSPDGTEILLVRYPYGADCVGFQIVDLEGNLVQDFITANECRDTPSWSPDGSRIAFLRGVGGYVDNRISVVNTDNTGLQDVYNPNDTDVMVTSPLWSPDSTKLIFMSLNWSHPTDGHLNVMDASGLGSPTSIFNGTAGSPTQWWVGPDL